MQKRKYIDAETKVVALFGHPVKHSFSPLMQNSAFAHLGLNYIYVAFNILPGNLDPAINAVRVLNLKGVNITIPYKKEVLPLLDRLDGFAELTGAVNTIINQDGQLYGYNTDGPGFIRSLEVECAFNVRNKNVMLVGAGGAAMAIGMQLALSGASSIGVVNRNQEKALTLANKIQSVAGVDVKILTWPRERLPVLDSELVNYFKNAELIVNCTPLGMHGISGQLPPLPYNLVSPGQLAYDLVYNPGKTRFMQKFIQGGAKAVNGLEMLLYQGALAFELWSGCKAPVEVMRSALLKVLK